MARALSPIITTIILVSMGIVFALIVFAWYGSWHMEVISKDINGVKKSADKYCQEVSLRLLDDNGELKIINGGNVPVYGLNVEKINLDTRDSKTDKYTARLDAGSTYPSTQDVKILVSSSEYDKVIVTPVLLGIDTKKKIQSYVCPPDNSFELTL
jgi:hypothetical protein